MNVKIFGREECNLCKATLKKFKFYIDKHKLKKKVTLTYYDLDTVDGVAEASYLDALDMPTTIIEKDGIEVARWEKKIPIVAEFRKYLEGRKNG